VIRVAVVILLTVVGSVVGGLVLLVLAALVISGPVEPQPAMADPAAAVVATQEATSEPSATQAAQQAAEKAAAEKAAREAEEKAAAEKAAAEKAAKEAKEEAEREAAETEAAEKEAADRAAKEAEEKAERQAAEKAAKEAAEKAAAEKEAADKAAKEAEEKAEREAERAGERVTVVAIIDGDTVDVSSGARIRLAGIDTPERGECGYNEAGARMTELARDREAVLVKAGGNTIDRYGRLIRYLEVDGRDVGLTLIQEGLAIARYDSRDGYGWHDREAEYVAADATSPQAYSCQPTPAPQPAPQPVAPQPAPQPPSSATDPRFGTCKEAKANGYGPYYVGVHVEYNWYRDADKDGIVCE
jgi:endonuclease YncB( thermonuclease family)